MAINTVLNWSSGKDAALSLYYLSQQPAYTVSHLLTTINAEQDRIFMHGIREELLDMQADRAGLQLMKVKLPPSPDDNLYKNAMKESLQLLKEKGVIAAAYGDIFLEDLKAYREQQLAQLDMQTVFPLWKRNTAELVTEVVAAGIEAMIVCVDGSKLGPEFLGRKIDESLMVDLPANVDPCGENGEYHSFVYNAPYFSAPVKVIKGETVHKHYSTAENSWGFYFMDVLPA
ncbi:ATP-binding protein [Chitinophagaceae bacterium MMS25-I14]